MNKIALVQYVSRASKQVGTPQKSIEFLTPLQTTLKEKDAHVYISCQLVHYLVLLGQTQEAKTLLQECEKEMEQLVSDVVINRQFYKTAAEYYKFEKLYPQYYHHALLFLSSVSMDELHPTEKQERAYELCMSALLGEGLYNFGELLMHPILDSLKQTKYEWLRSLLLFYNSGDLEGFDKVSKTGDFLSQALLVQSLDFLRQKLCLMTLVEVVFKRSKEERGRLAFGAIEKECRVPIEQVEYLVMKALSLGLIKGSMDQVDQVVEISWVQPRVLGKDQIKLISSRMKQWSERVATTAVDLEKEQAFQTVFAQ